MLAVTARVARASGAAAERSHLSGEPGPGERDTQKKSRILADVIHNGRKGTLMPPFGGKEDGLTDKQINILAIGILERWGVAPEEKNVPPYLAGKEVGNADAGRVMFSMARELSRQERRVREAGRINDPAFLGVAHQRSGVARSSSRADRPEGEDAELCPGSGPQVGGDGVSAVDEPAGGEPDGVPGDVLRKTGTVCRSRGKRGRFTAMKVRQVLKLLKADGWYRVYARGGHRQFKHPTKPGRVTVSGKPSIDVPPGTLNSIFKHAGWQS